MLFLAVYFWINRESPVVRKSSLTFLYMLIVGCVLIAVSSLIFMSADSAAVCVAQNLTLALGTGIILGYDFNTSAVGRCWQRPGTSTGSSIRPP